MDLAHQQPRKLPAVERPARLVRRGDDLTPAVPDRNMTHAVPDRQQVACVSVYQVPGSVNDDLRLKGAVFLIIQVLALHLLRLRGMCRETWENSDFICFHAFNASFIALL